MNKQEESGVKMFALSTDKGVLNIMVELNEDISQREENRKIVL